MSAVVYFGIVKPYERFKKMTEKPAAPEEAGAPTSEELLSEIRDLLKAQSVVGARFRRVSAESGELRPAVRESIARHNTSRTVVRRLLPHQPLLVRIELSPSGRGAHLQRGEPEKLPRRPQDGGQLGRPTPHPQPVGHLVGPPHTAVSTVPGVFGDACRRPAARGQGRHELRDVGASGLSQRQVLAGEGVAERRVPASAHR